MSEAVRVGLLGYGTVGSSLADLLVERHESLEKITGLSIELAAIAVRNVSKYAFAGVDAHVRITDDAQELVTSPDIDVIVELIGGLEPARSLILSAIKSGKPVITGNKELISNYGSELFMAADINNVDLLFEASTAGAIPILRPLRESLLGEDVKKIIGIVNGTTNYILSKMTDQGMRYKDALSEAQELGYAEADPTADVEGYDSAAKAAIMASLAFGVEVKASDVSTQGITSVSKFDISLAAKLGYVIKLIAVAEKFQNNQVGVRVYPALIESRHPLAAVRDSYNAVFVEGAASSELMFYGKGAGGKPTASAVLGDLVDAARNLKLGTYRQVYSGLPANIKDPDSFVNAHYIVLNAIDVPGALSNIAGLFAEHNISIRAIEQESLPPKEIDSEPLARIVFITAESLEADFNNLMTALSSFEFVDEVVNSIRVVSD